VLILSPNCNCSSNFDGH